MWISRRDPLGWCSWFFLKEIDFWATCVAHGFCLCMMASAVCRIGHQKFSFCAPTAAPVLKPCTVLAISVLQHCSKADISSGVCEQKINLSSPCFKSFTRENCRDQLVKCLCVYRAYLIVWIGYLKVCFKS